MLVGYGRVSTRDQSLDVQKEALLAAGCEEIFTETWTGTTQDGRDELKRCLAFVRKGDILLVTRLDRLARSMLDLKVIVAALTEKGVDFRCTTQPSIDTTTPMGRFTLNMIGAFAEFENDIRRERQKEGIEKARAKGVYKGRPPKSNEDKAKARALRSAGLSALAIGRELNMSRRTVYRATVGMWDDEPKRLVGRHG